MHTVIFKTFANTGEKEPKEISVEYIPNSDMVVFSIEKREIFSLSYDNNLEIILKAIDEIRYARRKDEE